jgi:hypothetical protein
LLRTSKATAPPTATSERALCETLVALLWPVPRVLEFAPATAMLTQLNLPHDAECGSTGVHSAFIHGWLRCVLQQQGPSLCNPPSGGADGRAHLSPKRHVPLGYSRHIPWRGGIAAALRSDLRTLRFLTRATPLSCLTTYIVS